MTKTWRESASSIIRKVIVKTGTQDIKLLKQNLRAAYPFGVRKYWPYKVWCDEIRIQLGHKKRFPRNSAKNFTHQDQLDLLATLNR